MNIVVWSSGLYVLALCIRAFGIIGAPLGTVVLGLIVGVGQSWMLNRLLPVSNRRWIGASIGGALLGALPVGLLFVWVILVAVVGVNAVLILLGAIFGGVVGATQATVLYPDFSGQVRWWVLSNIVSGALCAPLSLTGASLWLPVFCSLGPITFGVITALALRHLILYLEVE